MYSTCYVSNNTIICSYNSMALVSAQPTIDIYSILRLLVSLFQTYHITFLTHIVLPIFYAYLMRESPPEVRITYPAEQREALDALSEDMLQHLRYYRNGVSSRQLLRMMRETYVCLDTFDLNGRLYLLKQRNLVSSYIGPANVTLWISYD
jgi:hypothetical protein